MATINDIVWNYASNLSSTNAIVKSYARYLRNSVNHAKDLNNAFTLALSGELTTYEIDNLFTDEVYYINNTLIKKADLLKVCMNAVLSHEADVNVRVIDYDTIPVHFISIDDLTIDTTLGHIKNTLVSNLDAVYFSSVLFSSAEPLTNDKLSVSEKILAKSQICSEALSQIPNADENKISQIQGFIDSIADTTFDPQAILSTLCNFCGFNELTTLNKNNLNDFLSNIPQIGLDQYTSETPFNGFVNSVQDFLSDINVSDVLDFTAGLTFPAYGAFKFLKSAAKFLPKVLGAFEGAITGVGANVIRNITDTAIDPSDFILDNGNNYGVCYSGFNFNQGYPKRDFVRDTEYNSPYYDQQYTFNNRNPITIESIFGNVSYGYSNVYETTIGLTRLKPFNFSNMNDLLKLGYDEIDSVDYSTIQRLLTIIKPTSDVVHTDEYQLRNRLLNGIYVSAVAFPIMYLPIYFYIKLLDLLGSYNTSTEIGRQYYSQLYSTLFLNEWVGDIYPGYALGLTDSKAIQLLDDVCQLLFRCSKFLLNLIKHACEGTLFSFTETIYLHGVEIQNDIRVNFKSYDDTTFGNTVAAIAAVSTPKITRYLWDNSTTLRIKYHSSDIADSSFSSDYSVPQGWIQNTTLYDIFGPIACFLATGKNIVKSYCYLPYLDGEGAKPTFHIATDKENIDNFNNAVIIVALSIFTIAAIAATVVIGIKAKRSFTQTQSLIQYKKNLLASAIMSNDASGIKQYTNEVIRLQKKSKFLNLIGAGSLASMSDIVINNNSNDIVDSVCDFVNSKIGA